jgi:hypothetical protein
MAKIEAIKAIREYAYRLRLTYPDGTMGLLVKDAKAIVEEIEPMLQGNERTLALESALHAATARAECAREDLQTLERLVDFLVAHPHEWAAWKAEHTTTPHAGA